MARPAVKRRGIAKVGNYAAEVDSTDDPEMNRTLFGSVGATPMDKTEKDYVTGAKNKISATEAVRRARKANKQPQLKD